MTVREYSDLLYLLDSIRRSLEFKPYELSLLKKVEKVISNNLL